MKRVSVWKKSFETAKAVGSPALYLSLLGIAIPLVGFQWGMALFSTQQTEITNLLSPSHQGVVPFSELIFKLSSFSVKYLGWLIITAFLGLAAYLGIVYLCTQHLRGHPIGSARAAFFFGLKKSLRSFLGLVIFLFVFLFITQPMIMVGSIGASLLAFAPVLLVTENRGALNSCLNALTLGYAKGKKGLRRYAFVQAVSVGMFLMAGFALFLIGMGSLRPLMDLWLPRNLVSLRETLPFYSPYLIETLLMSGAGTVLAFASAVCSTTLYFIVSWLSRKPLREQKV